MVMVRSAVARASAVPLQQPVWQAKLRIGPVDDPLEREADRVADAVVSGAHVGTISAAPPSTAQRQCAHCAAEEEKTLRRKEASSASIKQGTLSSAALTPTRNGTPLTSAQRAYFEPRLGVGLADVRLHTGPDASRAADSIQARAYTLGHDITFAARAYQPETPAGQHLLTHELAHVVQQSRTTARVQRQPTGAAEIEMPVQWAFADPQKRTWRRYARQLAEADAARITKAGTLSAQDRAEINAKLDYFEGDAHEVYVQVIRPALKAAAQPKVEKPAADVSKPAPSPADALMYPGDLWAGFDRQRKMPEYFDNNIKEVNYFTAELARIHYKDGSSYDLGLVPRWMQPPVVEVDCKTPVEDFRLYGDPVKKTIGYMLESEMATIPRTMPAADIFKTYVHPVDNYAVPGNVANTAHIIPSRVNRRTAPTICGVIEDSERRFLENVNTAVQIGIGGTTAMAGYVGAGGWAKAPSIASTAAPLSRAILSPTARQLAREMETLVTQGGTKTVTAGGVRFTEMEATKQGTNLAVKRFEIRRVAPGGAGGKVAAEAFEDAAANVARSHGLKSVSINVGVIVNPGWRQWMESMGYVFVQTEGAWIKTIKL
jgi:Domain of unknown function (DUF4157)